MEKDLMVKVRVSKEEKEGLIELAKHLGLGENISALVRATLLRGDVKTLVNDEGEKITRGFPKGTSVNDFRYTPVKRRKDGGLELYSKLMKERFVIFPGDVGWKQLNK